jgi:DnaJ domain
MTAATAYPLCWPETFPRCKSREKGRFSSSLGNALGNVETSLKRFGNDSKKTISNIVLSSNCTLGVTNPSDPGVAVWFTWDDLHVCIPVDRYLTPASNLQAIHHVIEARRVELRHGTLALVRATMTGFLALPAPEIRWWEILGISRRAHTDEIENAFKKLAKECHPDRGGSTAMMAELNAARTAALKAVEP